MDLIIKLLAYTPGNQRTEIRGRFRFRLVVGFEPLQSWWT